MDKIETGRKRHSWQVVVLLFTVLFLASIVSALISTYGLTVTYYEFPSEKLTEHLRIVHLTDLHNSVFGEENARLIKKVAEQEPDLILITGDLLNYNEERTDIAENAIRKLAEIAPVYVSLGNHEIAYMERYDTDLKELYTAAGAVVLERSTGEIVVDGQNLVLIGFYGYGVPIRYYARNEDEEEEFSFLQEQQDQKAYSILLCHLPMSWLKLNALESWQFDSVLCGHVHGGQIRFPFIGGLWAPDQGWFPGEDCGMYISKDGTRFMELSRGLGNTEKIPRFNNIPEIVVLDLNPKQ